jgi:hypothetical protein
LNPRFTGNLSRTLSLLAGSGLLLLARAAVAAPDGVVLLDAGPGAVRFAVTVPAPELLPVPVAPDVQELRLEGFELDAGPGEPALLARVITVAVPPSGDVSVTAVALGTDWREGVHLARVPWTARAGDPSGADSLRLAAMIRGPTRPTPGRESQRPLARLVGVSWMRDQRVARIAVSGAVYDPATLRLGVHRRIEVEVRLPGGAPGPTLSSRATRDDPFEEIYRTALVNYDQGKAWRRQPTTAARASLLGGATPARATALPDTSIFAGRNWVKIAIPQTGFYKVYFGQLRNSRLFAGSDSTRVDSLRLFVWPGTPVLPEDSYCDSCGYREVAIGTVTKRGVFEDNNNDYFYFFALGASDWTDNYAGPQDPAQPDTVFLDHPYESRNFYYLTIATPEQPVPGPPKRIDNTQSGALVDTVGAVTPATFTARAHFEQDLEFQPDATPLTQLVAGVYRRTPEFWEKWFWTSLSSGGTSQFQESVDLPGLEPSLPARLRLRVWGLSLLVANQKTDGVFDHYLDLRFGNTVFQRAGWDSLRPWTFDSTVTGLGETGNTLVATPVPNAEADPPYAQTRVDRTGIAWFDIFYPRHFVPVANALTFDSDRAGGKYVYEIGPFTVASDPDSIRLFDVTDPYEPAEILGSEIFTGSGGRYMRFNRTESGRHRYRIIPTYPGNEQILKPPNSDVFDAPVSGNLRAGLRADYLVIYYDPFKAAADTLVAWRQQRLPIAGTSPPYEAMGVPISAIYDQFSGGRTDPGAIRNFLRAAFYNWSKAPVFVTLLGDASSDYKNLTGGAPPGQPGALVPSYENNFDFQVQRQYATDDWMLNVDDPARVVPDFLGGRIPAESATAALGYLLDKLFPYERTVPLGEWRDRVMLIADDNMQGNKDDLLAWSHMTQTARLDTKAMPPEIDRDYVYLHTYPSDASFYKPAARADVIAGMDDGRVLSNYIGHGSPFQLADEQAFVRSDVDRLVNRDRPTILVAASCDVGKYNIPGDESMGERILLSRTGGAVAVVSATEEAFSSQNANLNFVLYQQLFKRDATTGTFEASVAQALAVAKTGSQNNQKYQVLGDSAVRPDLPRLFLDGETVDVNGAPLDSVRRGQTVVFKGQLLGGPAGAPLLHDGIVHVLIEDSAPVDTLPDCFVLCDSQPPPPAPLCFVPCSYPFRASPMFRGDVSMTGGRFETRFVVPMNARLGPRGRARGYGEVQNGAAPTDAVGRAALAIVSGTAPTTDRTGPRIGLSFVSGSTRVRPDAVMQIDLFDESGILITGNVAQNGIIVTVDQNSSQRFEVTSSFRYAANSYQSGTASFRLPGLSSGKHRIDVSAADNLAAGITAGEHRSSAFIEFEVTQQLGLHVTRTILFPNPIRSGGSGSGGQFVIDAPGDSVDVLLKVYTVAGRLIRILKSNGGLAQVQIPWDGLDAEGQPLARGVYLFKAQVFPHIPGTGSDRADAEGRFVVVGR